MSYTCCSKWNTGIGTLGTLVKQASSLLSPYCRSKQLNSFEKRLVFTIHWIQYRTIGQVIGNRWWCYHSYIYIYIYNNLLYMLIIVFIYLRIVFTQVMIGQPTGNRLPTNKRPSIMRFYNLVGSYLNLSFNEDDWSLMFPMKKSFLYFSII